MYVSLHNRSCYSFGSALSRPEDLIAFARHHGMPAVGLTDLDGMYAAMHFYQACRKVGVKPIIGTELGLAEGLNLTLLARGIRGYGNLCRLVSLRQLREQPLELEDLGQYAEDVICLAGEEGGGEGVRGRGGEAERRGEGARGRGGDDRCERGFSHQHIQSHQHVKQYQLIKSSCENPFSHVSGRESFPAILRRLDEMFGSNLYVELAIHDAEGTVKARRRAGLADELGIPVVASCESRCMDREDGLLLRALQSIGTLTLLDQPHPDKPPGSWHFRTPQEMEQLFRRRPDALRNTLIIAEQCGFELDLDRNRFPPSPAPAGKTAMQHLRDLCIAGCKWRYIDTMPQKGMGGKRPTMSEALARLERELGIIEQVHYAEYFLVFHEIVEYCRSQGISTLARGSAADSLVCYALGVSHACPFRFDLPFDRFLNPERAKFSKMADIDLDLPWDQRDQVIRWVFDRWGRDRVAMIGLPNTFHARAAVAELGKIFGLPAHEVHKATKLLPHTAAFNIERAISRSPEARDFPIREEPYRTILQLACSLEGIPHHWAMHPCGAVVSPEPLTDLVPVQRSPKGHLIAQYDMDAIETMGFIKIDLLGQAGLSVLRDTVNEIRTSEHREIDLHNDIDYSDRATWHMIATGGARGVHHIESPAMTSLLRQCNCRDIDCLTAIVALIRPGAANQGKKELYVRRHQGFEPPHFVHPSLVPVLGQTYGLMVFEEHILQIATEFAGMNLGRADVLRRALNKENHKLIAEMKAEFWRCARQAGRTENEIADVWGQVEGFTGFMFNKAHSAEYAVEAFQGAWLKHRWPAHYLAAILSNYRGFYSHSPTLPQILYVMEALRLGIGILPPCVNRSGPKFRVETGGRGDAATGRRGESTWTKHDAGARIPRTSCSQDSHPAEAGKDSRQDGCEKGFSHQHIGFPRQQIQFSHQQKDRRGDAETWRRGEKHEGGERSAGLNPAARAIRIPVMHIKGIPEEFVTRYLAERQRGPFESLQDFLERCQPGEAESLALLDSGALDCFGMPRPYAFWHIRRYLHHAGRNGEPTLYAAGKTGRGDAARGRRGEGGHQHDVPLAACPPMSALADKPPVAQCTSCPQDSHPAEAGKDSREDGCEKGFSHQHHHNQHHHNQHHHRRHQTAAHDRGELPPVELSEPDLWQIARREMELLGFPVSIDPLTFLGRDDGGAQIEWSDYVPVNQLDQYSGRRVTVCGIMIADRINLTTGGDLMKFVSLADRTGVVEAFLFPDTYRRFGHLTVSNPILAASGMVEPFENRNGFNLRVEYIALPARKS